MCLTQVGTVSQRFVWLAHWHPSSRFQQRDEGVPRRPGGPPHLGCCRSNYLSEAHTQQIELPGADRSTHVPKLDQLWRLSLASVAETAITLSHAAG